MRYLVLSDIHSNLQALEAVLADASATGYDRVLVLGDLVGYGGDPSAVIARTMELEPVASVRGNHDKVCAGLEPPAGFGRFARVAIQWTASVLSRSELDILAALPKGPRTVESWLAICHGAPFDEDYYMLGSEDGHRAMTSTSARLCLFGHTHVPTVFSARGRFSLPAVQQTISLMADDHFVVNVGSVGQPRDGDTRAAYGILDTEAESMELRRVEYDIAGAQESIRRAGLPAPLADRLEYGR